MRQRTLLVLTWVLATGLATGAGFAAVFLVGDVVRGAGPLGAAYRTPAPEDDTGRGLAVAREIRLAQVRLVAECRGREATLLEAEPTSPWEVVDSELGPDEDVEVSLRHGADRIRVEVYCNRGEPREVVFG